MVNHKKENLGQVFTPPNVAKLMSYLLLRGKKMGDILDPCVGNNIFFNTINKIYKDNDFNYQGIEVDKNVIDKNFYKSKKRKIIIDSFFNFPVKRKYDYVILNPPYIRQEELSSSKFNNKDNIINFFKDHNIEIDKKANLYIYFILKAGMHLKQNGKMILICYDSWLYTKYGKEFKELFKKDFRLDKVIHLKKHAFDKVNVGATIIEATKTDINKNKSIFFEIDDKNLIPNFNSIYEIKTFINNQKAKKRLNKNDYSALKSCRLGDVFLDVRRGVESPANGIFYKEKKYKSIFYKPIIKDIKSIKKYQVTADSLLKIFLPNEEKLSKQLSNEINKIRIEVNNSKHLSLKNKIKSGNSNWYKIRPIKPGNIIFNYYFREKIDFIYNAKKYLASNNFYIINSKDVMLDLALLNSSFVRDSILSESRSQGNGLNKLQLFEFKKVLFPDKSNFNAQEKEKIRILGNKLATAKRGHAKSIISQIDLIIDKAKVKNK